jgi:hypothetical protein
MILIEIQLEKQQKKRQAAVTPFVLFFWLRHVTLQQVIIS